MTPLQIEILLRLRSHVEPFDGYTSGQKFSPSMFDAFNYFQALGLILSGLGPHTPWYTIPPEQRLTMRGLDLIDRLCQVNP